MSALYCHGYSKFDSCPLAPPPPPPLTMALRKRDYLIIHNGCIHIDGEARVSTPGGWLFAMSECSS